MRYLARAMLVLIAVANGVARAEPTITLASTTSVDNSGLLAAILPMFTRETGIVVRVVALGTGQALAVAARGDADLVLVHDPDAEAAFMAAGHGVGRVQIAWNDFLIVGPAADPAGVAHTHEGAAAMRAIAEHGQNFVSRGDGSGTHAQERRLWRAAGISPAGAWYRDIGAGMGAALNAASAMGAYTVVDRGTWLAYRDRSTLTPLVEGDPALTNRYDVITLTPGEHDPASVQPARRLAEWLMGEAGQAAIGSVRVKGEILFHPMADPEP